MKILKNLFSHSALFFINLCFFAVYLTTGLDEEHNCDWAAQTCKANPGCRKLYRSIKKKCSVQGHLCRRDDQTKEQCTKNLDDIWNTSAFKKGCGCYSLKMKKMLGHKCSVVNNLIFANPCYVVIQTPVRLLAESSFDSREGPEAFVTSTEAVTNKDPKIFTENALRNSKSPSTTFFKFLTTSTIGKNFSENYWDNYISSNGVNPKIKNNKKKKVETTVTRRAVFWIMFGMTVVSCLLGGVAIAYIKLKYRTQKKQKRDDSRQSVIYIQQDPYINDKIYHKFVQI